MTDGADVTESLATAADQDYEVYSGVTFPGLYAMMAQAHMHEFGTTREQLAQVAVKNHVNGSKNPKAQFRAQINVDMIGDCALGVFRDPGAPAWLRYAITESAKELGHADSFLPWGDLILDDRRHEDQVSVPGQRLGLLRIGLASHRSLGQGRADANSLAFIGHYSQKPFSNTCIETELS